MAKMKTVAPADLVKLAGEKFGFDIGILDLSKIEGANEILAKGAADAARIARRAEAVDGFVKNLPVAIRKLIGVISEMSGSAAATQAREVLEIQILGVKVADDTVTTDSLQGHARWQYAAAVMENSLTEGSKVRYGDVANDLESRGIIHVAEPGKPTGPIRHKNRETMYVPGRYPYELRSLVQEVFSGFATLAERSQAQLADQRDARREKFRMGANLSWDDLMAGVTGTFVLFSPTEDTGETVKDRGTGIALVDRRTGGPLTRKLWGGEFKVVSDGKSVHIIETNGIRPFVNAMGDAVTQYVTVPISDIGQERMGRLDPSVFQNLPKRGATYRLHGLLNRGYLQHLQFTEKKAVADASKAQATVDFTEFLLDGKDGVAHIQHRQFEDRTTKTVYRYPWVRIKRTTGDGGPMVQLLETNEHELFTGVGREPQPEGNDFAGLSKPLDVFLRLARNGAERKRTSDVEKAEQETTRQWAEGLRGVNGGNGDDHVDDEAAGPEQ